MDLDADVLAAAVMALEDAEQTEPVDNIPTTSPYSASHTINIDTTLSPPSNHHNSAAEQSHLLRLSPELRNQIYRHALLSHTPRALYSRRQPRELPLLSTSRQIRHEAAGIFWSENSFLVADALSMSHHYISGPDDPRYTARTSVLRRWLQDLGPPRAARLRHVRLLYSDACDRPRPRGTGSAVPQDEDDEDDDDGAIRAAAPVGSLFEYFTRDDEEPRPHPLGRDGAPVFARVARATAEMMLRGLREDGLAVQSVEPVAAMGADGDPWDQAFQAVWVGAMEEAKRKMAVEGGGKGGGGGGGGGGE